MEELLRELRDAYPALNEKMAQAAADVKKFGEQTAETKAAIDEINERISTVEVEIQEKAAALRAEKSAASELDLKADAARMSRLVGKTVSEDDYKAHRDAVLDYVGKSRAGWRTMETKALVEDSTGEIIVPFDLVAGVLRKLPQVNVMYGLCANRPTTRDRISLRAITELSVGWGKIETGATLTESTFTPTQEYVYVEDLYGITKIGEDELMDTDIALDQIVGSSFGIATANAIEDGILNGSGHGSSEPTGIITQNTTAGADGTTIVKTAAADATGGTLVWQDMVELEYGLKPQYAANAVFVVNRATAKAMRLFVPASGTAFPLWQPSLDLGQPPTFNGKPVYQSVSMPTLPTTTGTKWVALCGDFKSGYQVVERLGLTMMRLNELYAESGLVGFRVHRRLGGAVLRGEAIAALTSTHS